VLELVAVQLAHAPPFAFARKQGIPTSRSGRDRRPSGQPGASFSPQRRRKSGFAGVRAVGEVAVISSAIAINAGGALVAGASSVFAPGG